jgi:rubrerythrin
MKGIDMSTIWDVAKKMELEGKKMYESLATKAPGQGLAGVFAALALEEQRHWDLFDSLEKSMPAGSFATSPALIDIDGVFQEIRDEFNNDDTGLKALTNAETLYNKALVLEKKSVAEYTKLRDSTDDEFQQGIVGMIIDEEERHVELIEGLIDFVSRPQEWLEDAEIHHGDDY